MQVSRDAHLLRLQVTDDSVDAVQYFIDERHQLTDLHLHEVTTAFLSYFDERVTGHVLNTVVCLCTTNQQQHVTVNSLHGSIQTYHTGSMQYSYQLNCRQSQ